MKKTTAAGMLTMFLAFSLIAVPFGEELTGSENIQAEEELSSGALPELTDTGSSETVVPVGDDDNTDGNKDDTDGNKDDTDGNKDDTDGNKDDTDGNKDEIDGNKNDTDGNKDDTDGNKDDTDGNTDDADGDDDKEDEKEYLAEGDGWRLDTEGNLEFTAAGALPSASFQGSPLYEYRDQILTVAFADGVTAIGRYLFQDCSKIKTIVLPDSVVSLGAGCFYGCTSLESITLPQGLTAIGDSAFSKCGSLQSFAWPAAVTQINMWMFVDCTSLSSIEIPEGVTEIGLSAFDGCTGLRTVRLPESIKAIGNLAFHGCSLSDVYYGGDEETWAAIDVGTSNDSLYTAELHCDRHIPVIADINKSTVQGLENRLLFKPGVSHEFTVKGAGMDNEKPGEGDTRWVPQYWKIENSTSEHKEWKISSNGIKEEKDIPILIFLQEQKYTEGQWTDTENMDSIGAVVKTQAYSDVTPTPTPVPEPTKAPITGLKEMSMGKVRVQARNLKTQVDGYQFKWSTDSKFETGVKSASSTKHYHYRSGLAGGKTYYFKARTYKIINGKKVYSTWSGTKSIKLTILPPKTTITSLKPKGTGFTVKWTPQSEVDGYQIRYSTSSVFSGAKTASVTGAAKTSQTRKNLESGREYFVSVRTFKLASDGTKYYSPWSDAKSVKVQ